MRKSPIQHRLYRRFLAHCQGEAEVDNPLKAFAVCCKVPSDWSTGRKATKRIGSFGSFQIWNHPDILKRFLGRKSKTAVKGGQETGDDLDLAELQLAEDRTEDGRGRQKSSAKTPKSAKTLEQWLTVRPDVDLDWNSAARGPESPKLPGPCSLGNSLLIGSRNRETSGIDYSWVSLISHTGAPSEKMLYG